MELSLIKYTLSLFLTYPMAVILRTLPGTTTKHIFSIFVGVFLLQWVFEEDWIHSFLSSIVTYLICAFAPMKSVGPMAFVWAIGYMTMSHWYRMYTSYMSGKFDFTGTQMVLTMKLTSFAWNYWDGTYDYKQVFASANDLKFKERRRLAITKLPSLIEFLGYIYCFTCLMAGPAFEYKDYITAIDGSAFVRKSNSDETEKDKESKIPAVKVTPPSSLFPALKALLIGLASLAMKLVLGAYFPLSRVLNLTQPNTPYNMIPTVSDPEWIFRYPNHIWRFLRMMAALQTERYKYYFAWKVAEGSCILAGFGFEGYNEKGDVIGWRGVENIDILGFETSWCVSTMTRAWNKRTQKWLELYSYQRSGKSLIVTYFISALWHGLYPGFYLFFMSVPIVTEIERLSRTKLNPIFIPTYNHKDPSRTYPYDFKGLCYMVFGWLAFFPMMNYITSTFAVGSLENSLRALGSYYFVPNVALIAAYLFLLIMPVSKETQKKIQKKE